MKYKNEEIYNLILLEVKNNSKVTEEYLAEKFLVSERTIRRYIRDLKINKKIILVRSGRLKEWKIM